MIDFFLVENIYYHYYDVFNNTIVLCVCVCVNTNSLLYNIKTNTMVLTTQKIHQRRFFSVSYSNHQPHKTYCTRANFLIERFIIIMIPSKVVAIVTGAASGLGRATTTRIAKQGGRVVIADLPSSEGQSVAEELGENVVFAPTDVR